MAALYVTPEQIGARIAENLSKVTLPGHAVTLSDLYSACDDFVVQTGATRLIIADRYHLTNSIAEALR